MSSFDRYRLPRTVAPRRYELVLEPDLQTFTFTGKATIDVEVIEPTASVVLNAIDLDLVPPPGVSLTLDDDLERATLTYPEPLPKGQHTIELAFTGEINDQLAGFYRSVFTDEAGNE